MTDREKPENGKDTISVVIFYTTPIITNPHKIMKRLILQLLLLSISFCRPWQNGDGTIPQSRLFCHTEPSIY